MVHTESLYLQVYERLSEFGLRFSHSNPLSALTFFYQFTPQIFADSKSVSRSFDLQKIGSIISQTIREQDNKKIIVLLSVYRCCRSRSLREREQNDARKHTDHPKNLMRGDFFF